MINIFVKLHYLATYGQIGVHVWQVARMTFHLLESWPIEVQKMVYSAQ